MNYIEIFLIGIGLSMDAVAVSMSNTIIEPKMKIKKILITAILFGLFQGIMPTIGYFAGMTFSSYIKEYDHWIAFLLLAFIGGKMIYDAFTSDDENQGSVITNKILLLQAIATSIDALAVGVGFAAMFDTDSIFTIIPAVSLIALTTFTLSFTALIIGKKFGDILGSKAQILGGVILVGIGAKILIEHLFF